MRLRESRKTLSQQQRPAEIHNIHGSNGLEDLMGSKREGAPMHLQVPVRFQLQTSRP